MTNIRIIVGWVALLLLAIAPGSASGQTESVSVRASANPANAYVGQPVRFSIEIRGTADANQPVIDAVEGLDLRFAGGQDRSSSMVSVINGRRTERRSESYVYQWVVRAETPGTYTVPPVEVTAGGVNYRTSPVTIRYVEPPTTQEMLLDVSLERGRAYVGEPIRMTIDWYFARRPDNWTFAIPGVGDAFELVSPASIADTSGEPVKLSFMGREVSARQAQARVDDMGYARVRIEQMLIPRESGPLRIDGARVSADLVTRESIFREETKYVMARTGDLELDVVELPSAGRPANFNGLTGAYSIEALANASRVSVGDPIDMTLAVDGPLVESVNPPALHLQTDLARDFRVPEDLGLSQIENGKKVWRFTLRAKDDRVERIPPIQLPYFDTDSGTYSVATTAPIPLEVNATRRVTLSDAEGAPIAPAVTTLEETDAGIAHNYAGEGLLVDQRFTIAGAVRSPATIALTAGPVGFWAASLALVAVRKRSRSSKKTNDRRRAGAMARKSIDSAEDAAGVGRALYEYAGRALDRAPSGLTPGECERLFEPRHAEAAREFRDTLEACDAASYAGASGADAVPLRERARSVVERIETARRAR